MAAKKQLKLTNIQAEILEALVQGRLISIDSMNMATMGERVITPQTRYFLTDNRLVTRKKNQSSNYIGKRFRNYPEG